MWNMQIIASPYTRLFWNEYQLNPKRYDYNIVFDQQVTGDLDIDRLSKALKQLVKDHVLLNSHLIEADDELYWQGNETISELQVFKDTSSEKDFVIQTFNLEKGPLYRFGLFKLPNQNGIYHLILILHQSIIERSFNNFINLVSSYYNTQGDNLIDSVVDLSKQIEQIIALNQNYIDRVKYIRDQGANDYWRLALKGLPPKNELPYDKPMQLADNKDGVTEYRFNIYSSELAVNVIQQLKTTWFTLLSGVWGVLLSKYTNQDEIGIAYPVGMKAASAFQYGGQINTVILPIRLHSEINLTQLIGQLNTQVKSYKIDKDHRYSYLPIDEVIHQSNIKKLNVSIAQTNLKDKAFEFKGCQVEINKRYNIDIAGSELILEYAASAEQFHFRIRYREDLFSRGLIERLGQHYKNLLKQIIKTPTKPIGNISLLTGQEYQQIVYDWNQTDKEYPRDKTIQELFQQQVEKTPDNIAVMFEDKQLTYKELNEQSNQLARYIIKQYQQQGCQIIQSIEIREEALLPRDTLIALCLDRSIEMIIGILGVLKSGGAYVPIDPNYPQERIDYILKDTQTAMLLSQSHLKQRLSTIITDNEVNQDTGLSDIHMQVDLICLDEQPYTKEDKSNLTLANQSTDLAYVIYTSGTTGKPKGTLTTHKPLVNRLLWQRDEYGFNEDDSVLQKTPYIFDVSVWELLLPLLSGSRLVFAKAGGHKDTGYLHDLMNQQGITKLHFVPSMLQAYLGYVEGLSIESKQLSNVTDVFCSGEALSVETSKRFKQHYSDIKLHNLYGPTEVAIDVSCYNDIQGTERIIPIGKPIQNINFYVLDPNQQPVAIGVIGELYVRGAGLARGYLRRPDITEAKFVENPFATESDKQLGRTRLYKTGDLVRWLTDGNLEYIGRNDFQVKIRGYRIELGEIESVLASHPAIQQACVLARSRGSESDQSSSVNDKYLVAYYVLRSTAQPILESELLAYLSDQLPEYMLPSFLLALESFPLTVNGKLDRNALPAPDVSELNKDQYVAPRDEQETELCRMWSEVLGLGFDQVSIVVDFFRLGGNSILAIQLSHKLSKYFAVQISVADIFKYKTIAQQSDYLKRSVLSAEIIIPQYDQDQYALSYAQERLWFIEQYEQGSNAYHIPILLKTNNHVCIDSFKRAIQAIVSRHEVLRTIFTLNQAGEDVQQVLTEPLLINQISVMDYQGLLAKASNGVNRPFNLRKDYPLRVCIYHVANKHYYILINTHHIASDGWSIDIFQRELLAFYQYYAEEKPLQLPELTIQYKDFALWQREYIKGDRLQYQLDYWKSQLANYEPLSLPTDKPRSNQIDYHGAIVHFQLGLELSKNLKKIASNQSCSLYTVLLSSFYVLLHRYSGQEDIIIGTPIANRHYPQVDNLIGIFINTLALRAKIFPLVSIIDLIQKVHQQVKEAQEYQDIPFEKLVNELSIERDLSRHPIFQVFFRVQSFTSKHQQQIFQEYFSYKNISESYNVATFDLDLLIDDSTDELTGSIEYHTSIYNQKTIERLLEHYIHILDQLSKQPKQAIKDYQVLTDKEYQKIVYDWNQTDKEYPRDKTIQQLFQQQVEKTPNNIAVVYEDKQLTYQELNQQSNQLARYIRSQYELHQLEPLRRDTLIGLCLDRSIEMIIGILGVLKAGGAYVPMDPNYPQDRIEYILEDTQTSMVLSQSHLLERLSEITLNNRNQELTNVYSIKVIALDKKPYTKEDKSNLTLTNQSTDLAYVIYTSGTTGKSKASLINQYAVVNLNYWYANEFNLTVNDTVIICSELCFDLTQKNYLAPLMKGSRIISYKGIFDSFYIADIIIKHNVNRINCAPSAFKSISEALAQRNKCNIFDYIFLGGEPISIELLKEIREQNSQGILVNTYGPSECGDVTHYYPIKASHINLDKNIPIGKAVNNLKNYIFDKYFNPVPIGVIGELYIGGSGLARGYLNRPELTQKRFIPNPFSSKEDKAKGYTRLYKTGDLVRWLADGNLEYIGRNDFQVKIRGYRIELGEIESVLASHPAIQQACVLARSRGSESDQSSSVNDKYLVAYYVLRSTAQPILESELLAYLSDQLPEYMLPSFLLALESFPLTVNGKLDRNALPAPDVSELNKDQYVAPRDEQEAELCRMWSEVLGLGFDQVSIVVDFFRLGGNSILAIQLSHKLSKYFAVQISVADIFKYKTIAQQSDYLKRSVLSAEIIIPQYDQDQYALSYAQERLWFIEQYEQGSNAYHIPMLYELSASVNLKVLQQALEALVQRQEVLRTVFRQDEGSGLDYQQVLDKNLKIADYQLKDQSVFELQVKADINRVFDLRKDYPIRVVFYEVDQEANLSNDVMINHYVLINIHHIAFDGWSIEILERELLQIYENLKEGKEISRGLPELSIQYKDYAQWQRGYLQGTLLQQQINYWQDQLTGLEPLALVTDYPRPSQIDYRGSDVSFQLTESLSSKLRGLSQRLGCTLYTVLLSGFYILLHKYTSQTDLVLGSPIANRDYHQVEGLIGFFVNALPLRLQLDVDQGSQEIIQQLHSRLIESQSYQDIPFEKIVEQLKLSPDPSRHPIFQVMFGVQDFGDKSGDKEGEVDKLNQLLRSKALDNAYEVAKFDLSLFITDKDKQLQGSMNYATALFKRETIERLLEHYIHILDQLIKQPKQAIKDYQVLTDKEYQQIVYDWNQTDKEYPTDKTIQQLFQQQVEKTPNNIALVYEDKQLTYQELNQQSNQLARYIIKQYQQQNIKGNKANQQTQKREADSIKTLLPKDTLIALCLDRSIEMIVGILGVLKAGGAYVPMDPNYPQDRIEYILKDTQTAMVLSQSHLKQRLSTIITDNKVNQDTGLSDIHMQVDLICLDEQPYTKEDKSNLTLANQSTDLAYVIYTSGTTGKPKGTLTTHKPLVNRLLWQRDEYGFNEDDSVLQKTPYIFDVSVWELLLPLLSGSRLVFAKAGGHKDTGYLHDLMNQQGITKLHFVPSMLQAYLGYVEGLSIESKQLSNVTDVFCSGEALSVETSKRFKQHYSDIKLHNLYGPTEVAIDVSCYNDIQGTERIIPIGKPIQNINFYVLDPNQQPVAIGVIGELYVRGAGLARGYLRRPDITEAKFVENPFATESDKQLGRTRLYKTGDLVRWLTDGNLEYIGRNDFQVKIRGYRIELGEIESVLASHPVIQQACVLARSRGIESDQSSSVNDKYLVGYYVLSSTAQPILESELLAYLSDQLPEYMLPSFLLALESFPLTVNGKLDRNALPAPDVSELNKDQYVAPRDEQEAELCRMWSEVLGLGFDQVSIVVDFFRLGGNSILAIQLSHKLSKYFAVQISVADIFKYKTIAQQSDYLKRSVLSAEIIIPQYDQDQYALSYAQERLWFIEQYEQGSNAYHIPMLYELSASVNLKVLQQALEALVQRQEVLRTVFRQDEGSGLDYQQVLDKNLKIADYQLKDQSVFELQVKADINRVFDLRKDYPIRVVFYEVDQEANLSNDVMINHYVLINIHHIAFDGWSIEILERELLQIYENLKEGKEISRGLPELSIQYKDYAQWQRGYLQGILLQQQINYWQDQLTGLEPLALVTDYPRPSQIDYRGSDVSFQLTESLSSKLRGLSQRLGCTLYTVLLSGFYILLHKYTSQTDLVLGSPIANRDYHQVEGLIGFFVNALPLRLQLDVDQGSQEIIQQLHSRLIESQSYQDIPFEKIVEQLKLSPDPSRHPIFQVMFGVQDFGDKSGDKEGEVDKLNQLLRSKALDNAYEVAKFDLSLFITDKDKQLQGSMNYATALFKRETIERLLEHYIHILDQLSKQPKQAIKDYQVLTDKEYQQIVYDWNQTDKEYPTDKTIQQLFQEQVEKTPDNIAVVYEDKQLTYQELNQQSNQLARYIIKQYQQQNIKGNKANQQTQKREADSIKTLLPKDTLIALCLDRSIEMIVGILGVLKAGGAYVPMDPNYPQERIDYILKDTQTAMVLSQSHLKQRLSTIITDNKVNQDTGLSDTQMQVDLICLDEQPYTKEDKSNLTLTNQSTDLAYVIYTSGTTGKPKGVNG